MKLLEFVVPEAITLSLNATTKEEVIREIVKSLHDANQLPTAQVENAIDAILEREKLGSTGIGQGVAVPHSRFDPVKRLICAVAISRRGVEFEALDRGKVNVFFLLISPPLHPGDHLRALETIARHLKDPDFVTRLRGSTSAEQVIELLREADLETPKSATGQNQHY